MDATESAREVITSGQKLAQGTGDLVKSTVSFSWAMSLLTARQVAAMMLPTSPSRQVDEAASAMNRVTRAAAGQLDGAVRTTFAMGNNIQTGLVDLAFSAVTPSKKGAPAPPAGATKALSIPMWTGGMRRVAGVRTVSSGAVHRPVPQQELVSTLARYQEESSADPRDLETITIGLWKSEGFSTTVGKYLLPENTLADRRLPRQTLGIAHVGFGSGSTERLVFDVAKLTDLFETRAHPDFKGFSYEGIGAILRIYEPGFFKVMSGALGLIRLDAPDPPDPKDFYAGFLGKFPSDIQRLIVHGYGRIIAFSSMNIYGAIREATTLPAERVEAAVHGCGFAFAYMNNADMPRILENSAVPFDDPIRAAFQSGIVFALVFFEWYVPGGLAAWQPKGKLEAELIDRARAEAALAQKRGYLLPFRLENPIR